MDWGGLSVDCFGSGRLESTSRATATSLLEQFLQVSTSVKYVENEHVSFLKAVKNDVLSNR